MRHRVRLLVCAGCIAAFMTASSGHAGQPSFFQGSVYEYVPTYTTWDRARAEAETMSFMGFPGRLATITSAAENAFIASLVPVGGNTMLGGSDAQTEGTWLWETGPEAVSYTHLRAHETVLDLVCRLLLEKKHDNTGRTLR